MTSSIEVDVFRRNISLMLTEFKANQAVLVSTAYELFARGLIQEEVRDDVTQKQGVLAATSLLRALEATVKVTPKRFTEILDVLGNFALSPALVTQMTEQCAVREKVATHIPPAPSAHHDTRETATFQRPPMHSTLHETREIAATQTPLTPYTYPERCCARVYYCLDAGLWNITIVFSKHLMALEQYARMKLKGATEGAQLFFTFKEECVSLKLEKIKVVNGWQLCPLQYPCQVRWSDVRRSEDLENLPNIKIIAYPKHNAANLLHHEVLLTGTVEDGLSFFIYCQKTPGSAIRSPPVLGIGHLDIIKQELPNFVGWRRLGLRLGLSPRRLEVIEEDYRDADGRLDQVLIGWLRRNYNTDEYGSPSWDCLANALEPIDHALADSIRENH